MIAIIDYGAGNLHSVKNALDFLNTDSIITSDEREILNADKVILPGVGSFGHAMQQLTESGLDKTIHTVISKNIPLLGICLGLHLLFDSSYESPNIPGLGVFPGQVVKIKEQQNLKIPHIGWNSLDVLPNSNLMCDLGRDKFVYFVHSYYIQPKDTSIICATTNYGDDLPIAVEHGNVYAMQFHPEKSGLVGLSILKRFIQL